MDERSEEKQVQQAMNLYEGGIVAIQSCSKLYRVKFEISCRFGTWRIKVMGKIFNDAEFNNVCALAVAFVFNAHKNNNQ